MKARRRLVFFFLLLACVSTARTALAQPDGRRFEVGGQLATLRLSDFDATNAGVGGRVSYDFGRWLTAEAELNFFGHDYFETGGSGFTIPDFKLGYSRRRVEGFFGPKVGIRGQRFGVFAKARPGFSRLADKGVKCIGEACALLMLLARPGYRTEAALDLGGVLEFYPTARIVARIDLGSTMIRHRSTAPPCTDCTSRNFSSRFGLGFRF